MLDPRRPASAGRNCAGTFVKKTALFFQIHSSLAGVLHHGLSSQPASPGRQAHIHNARPHPLHPLHPTNFMPLSGAQTLPRNSCLRWLGAVGPTLGYVLLVICINGYLTLFLFNPLKFVCLKFGVPNNECSSWLPSICARRPSQRRRELRRSVCAPDSSGRLVVIFPNPLQPRRRPPPRPHHPASQPRQAGRHTHTHSTHTLHPHTPPTLTHSTRAPAPH